MIVTYMGYNLLLPIHGCLGQRGSTKQEERVDHMFDDSMIVFFSKAKMPSVPIVKILRKLKGTQLFFVFLVDDKVLRDPHQRKTSILTENSNGTVKRNQINKLVSSSDDGGSYSPTLKGSPIQHMEHLHASNITMSDPQSTRSPDTRKRKLQDVVMQQLQALDDPDGSFSLGEDQFLNFVNALPEDKLSLVSDMLLSPLVSQRKHRMDFHSIEEDLLR